MLPGLGYFYSGLAQHKNVSASEDGCSVDRRALLLMPLHAALALSHMCATRSRTLSCVCANALALSHLHFNVHPVIRIFHQALSLIFISMLTLAIVSLQCKWTI